MRTIDLTVAEWRSLNQLPMTSGCSEIPSDHRVKLIRLGVAAEKAGKLVATFEGRLMLRQYKTGK
jgi:hypothetical protein